MPTSRLALLIGFAASVAASQASAQPQLRGGTVVTPVTVTATCDGGSTMDVTIAALRRANQLTVFSTLLVGGFWDVKLNDESGRLLSGHGSTVPDISGSQFYRSTINISGPIRRGTSTFGFIAERHDPILDPVDSPVLETCVASLTVTAR